jgi:hypothetical protein
MKLMEIEQEALALPDRDRASLAAKLLDTLPPPGTDVSDEEVEQREREMESGHVTAISHQEFVRRVQEQRGRSCFGKSPAASASPSYATIDNTLSMGSSDVSRGDYARSS